MLRVFLDNTDVILNVLCEEEDLESGVRLWPAPKEILFFLQSRKLLEGKFFKNIRGKGGTTLKNLIQKN